jgi:hypothetical protein
VSQGGQAFDPDDARGGAGATTIGCEPKSLRVVALRATSRVCRKVPPKKSIAGLLTPNQNFSLMK